MAVSRSEDAYNSPRILYRGQQGIGEVAPGEVG